MQSRDRCHFWFGMGVFFYLGLAVFGLSAMCQNAEAQIFLVKSISTLTPDGGELGLNIERLMVLDSTQGRIATLDDLGGIPEGVTVRASSVPFRTEGILESIKTGFIAFNFDEKTLELEFQYKTVGGALKRLVVAKAPRFQRAAISVKGSREEVIVYELEFLDGVKIKSLPLIEGIGLNKREEVRETDSNGAGVLVSLSIDQLSEHIALARANLEEREKKTRELHRVLDELLTKDLRRLSEAENKRLDRQFPALATVFEVFVNGLREEIENAEGGPTGGSETVGGAGAQPPKERLDLQVIERLREVFYEIAAAAPVYNAIDIPRYNSEGNRKGEDGLSAPVLSVKGRLIDLIDLYYLLLSEATMENSSAAKLDGSSKAQVAMENAFRVLLEIYVTVGKSNDLHLNKGFHIIQSVGFSVASVALGGLAAHLVPEGMDMPIRIGASVGFLLGLADLTGVFVSMEKDDRIFGRPGGPKPYFWSNPWLKKWASRKGANSLLENFVRNMAAFVSRDGSVLELEDPSFSPRAFDMKRSVMRGFLSHLAEAQQGESGRETSGNQLRVANVMSLCRKVISQGN
jgi:hypothetical protein